MRLFIAAGAFFVCGLAFLTPASAKPAHVLQCGPVAAGRAFTEPPRVEMWHQPLNASGEHELILAVRHDRDRFCYRYTLDGQPHIGSPAIHVRRGEHFALRIVNELSGPALGATMSSAILAPCSPSRMMMMHQAGRYPGYLNHTVDDLVMAAKDDETNIHLHGFQGPPLQENVFLSTLSTPAHACEYHFTIPQTQPPGTYFYHPHAHGSSDDEVAGGLGGAWIVEPDTAQISAVDDHLLVLQYSYPFSLDNKFVPAYAQIARAGFKHFIAAQPKKPVAYDPFNPPAWPVEFPFRAGAEEMPLDTCNGFSAETNVSFNGSGAGAEIIVPAGRQQLLRILNATSDSPKLIALRATDGKPVPLKIAAIDGVAVSGDAARPYAHYESAPSIMIPPAGRTDLLLTVDPGDTLVMSSGHFCEGTMAFFQSPHDLLRIQATPTLQASSVAPAAQPIDLRQTPAAKLMRYVQANRHVVRRRAITLTEYVVPRHGNVPQHDAFFITDTTNANFSEHAFSPVYDARGFVPSNADIVVKHGTVEEWYVYNTTLESHAFHIHQMAFVVESGPGGNPATVDTMFNPVGTLLPNRDDPDYPLVKPSVTKILLDFRTVERGTFVFHCHMLFHEHHGMMGIIRVV